MLCVFQATVLSNSRPAIVCEIGFDDFLGNKMLFAGCSERSKIALLTQYGFSSRYIAYRRICCVYSKPPFCRILVLRLFARLASMTFWPTRCYLLDVPNVQKLLCSHSMGSPVDTLYRSAYAVYIPSHRSVEFSSCDCL